MPSATVKIEEGALYDSQSNGLAESAVKNLEDAVRTNLACFVKRFGREFPGGHPVLPWLVKHSVAMVSRCRRRPDGKTVHELRKGRKCASSTAFCGEDPLHDPWVTKGVARVEPRWEDGIFLGVSDRSGELCVGTERGHAQGSTSRGHRKLTSLS